MDTRKLNESATNLAAAPLKKRASYLTIQILGTDITISDYSTDDDRKKLLALLSACGVQPTDVNESWCG